MIGSRLAVGFLAALAALCASCFTWGCCTGGAAIAPGPEPIDRGPAPSYEEIAAQYNARAADAGLIWAQSTTRIWYTDEEGEEQSEQADGTLQHVSPHDVFLEVRRFGTTYALLGANSEQYWWISLGDERSAIVGRHDDTTPQAAARAGLPVHPLDLLALIGAAPIAPESGAGETWWSEGGRTLMVSSPGRWGRIIMALDPDRLEPVEVTIQRDGEAAVTSQLHDYVPYERRSAPSDVRMPGEVMIIAHESGARIRMSLSQYRATSRQPNRSAYDLEDLLGRYRVPAQSVRRVEEYQHELSARPGTAPGAGS